jgi:hypothetical protein
MRLLIGIMFAGVIVVARPAEAQTIYSTGFENPPFNAGQPLPGQDGWDAQIVGGVPLGPNGQISTAQPKTGLQSVAVRGMDLTPLSEIGYDVAVYRHFVNYNVAAAGFPIIRVAADLRIDGPQTAQTADRVTGDFFSANLKAFSSDGSLGEFSLSSDGHVYVYTNDDSYLFGATSALGQYHHLAIDLNFSNKTTTFSIDGTTLGSVPFTAGFGSNILSHGTLLAYGLAPDPLGRDVSAYTAYYDNFSITAVPEPSAVILSGLGGAGVFAMRRRRR